MWWLFDGFLGYGGGSFLRVSGFLMGVFLLLFLGFLNGEFCLLLFLLLLGFIKGAFFIVPTVL